LSTRQSLLAGGDNGEAVIPGKADRSLLIAQISGTRPAMPRKGNPLSAEEIADLRRWIDAGAPWPKGLTLLIADAKPIVDANWWSLRPLARPTIPQIRNLKSEIRNPIDAFILAKLEEKGLRPSPEADRRTLIRRLTFNLHGLPPTPEEIDAFERDTSANAYE